MLRTMLLGLDGSPHAESALTLGLRWAKTFDAMLVGQGVIDEPAICAPDAMPLGAMHHKEHRDQRLMKEMQRRVEHVLERFSIRCSEAGVSSKVLEDTGAPEPVLLRQMQRYDLLVLGRQTHLHFGAEESADKTLTNVLMQSSRPLVTAAERDAPGEGAVLAFDGSEQASRALQAFTLLGLTALGPVHVVSVASDHRTAADLCDRAADYLRHHNVTAVIHPLHGAWLPGDALLERISAIKPEVVVVGSQGKPRLRDFFIGSNTRRLLQRCPSALFLYH